jgi:2-amino-4-hydroxy-6-hydroxymethyldihydropteridine diphosphokinase
LECRPLWNFLSMLQKIKIAIALGSNLGDRKVTIEKAFERMSEEFLEGAKLSTLHETKPWGIKEQPDFLNAVAIGYSEWKPPAIVNYLKNLERDLGRTNTVKNGPRVIDLDLLIWGDHKWDSEGVTVPHPGMTERDFVLLPLKELWPEWVHPIKKKSVRELAG